MYLDCKLNFQCIYDPQSYQGYFNKYLQGRPEKFRPKLDSNPDAGIAEDRVCQSLSALNFLLCLLKKISKFLPCRVAVTSLVWYFRDFIKFQHPLMPGILLV